MALAALSGDEQGIVFIQLCNALDPGIAVALSSVQQRAQVTAESADRLGRLSVKCVECVKLDSSHVRVWV